MVRTRVIACELFLALPLLVIGSLAAAQQDGGSILRELERPVPLDERLPAPEEPARPEDAGAEGRQAVRINAITVIGNSRFSDAQLTAALDERLEEPLTLSDLEQFTAHIRDFYRREGYLVRVFLPEQTVDDGVLIIRVIEGRPGERSFEILPEPDSSRIDPDVPSRFIDHALDQEKLFRIDRLERAERLLNDLPGFEADIQLSPGRETGRTDITTIIQATPIFTGRATADNAGSEATGEARGIVRADLNSPLGRGDRWSLTGLETEGNRYFRAQAAMPLGYDGWRFELAGSQLDYELVNEFAALDVEGDVRNVEANLRYPLLREARGNLYFQASVARSENEDRAQGAVQERREIDAGSLAIEADRRDSFLGGGVNYGRLELRAGEVSFDIASAETRELVGGDFGLLKFSFLRVQSHAGLISQTASFRVSLEGQYSDSNLPSSERLSLGGNQSVRAYPPSEASGDDGLMLSLEWREALRPQVSLYGFYDHGWVRERAGAGVSEQTTDLAGVGLGVIARIGERVAVDGSVATRVTEDTGSDDWQGWISAELAF